jgi:hypothetical protein
MMIVCPMFLPAAASRTARNGKKLIMKSTANTKALFMKSTALSRE